MWAIHVPVLYKEVLNYLIPANDLSLMVDSTLGEGGHSELFLKKYKNIHIIGLDADSEIQSRAQERLSEYKDRIVFKNDRFDHFWKNYLGPDVDIILFDLGISVYHYKISKRGFSFLLEENLDMRLDRNDSLNAEYIVNNYDEVHLADIIYKYGEERYSRRISRAICTYRKNKKIKKTSELADIIYKAVPKDYKHLKNHPATKTFQALRIEVNDELNRLSEGLKYSIRHLNSNGLLGVITFHSLEDRIVKNFFKENVDSLEILTKKPIVPSDAEILSNPPSRSAKFRVVRRKKNEV